MSTGEGEEEKWASMTKYEKVKARTARLEAERQQQKKNAQFHEGFKRAPKQAIALVAEKGSRRGCASSSASSPRGRVQSISTTDSERQS